MNVDCENSSIRIFSANSCNADIVIEVVGVVLEELLKYQPANGSWLKLAGDVNFGNSLHSNERE